MQQADDLMSAATEAQAVTCRWCSWCQLLIAPIAPNYARKSSNPPCWARSERRTAVFRELLVDVLDDIRDFDGNMTSASEIAERYGADLTPTLLFLAPNGAEAAARIVGIKHRLLRLVHGRADRKSHGAVAGRYHGLTSQSATAKLRRLTMTSDGGRSNV